MVYVPTPIGCLYASGAFGSGTRLEAEGRGSSGVVKSGEGQSASAALSYDRHSGADGRLPRIWVGLSASAALLSIVGCIVGLLAPSSIYGEETTALADAATA